MAPIGTAIIGGGIWVKERHLVAAENLTRAGRQPAVLNTDILSLKAIYSRSLKSATDTASLVTGTTPPDLYASDAGSGKTYHDLLLRTDIQAVIVALPILSQPEHIEAALAAGKHVLAEKPIAGDTAAARKLMEYYRGREHPAEATLAIAENYRFFPSFAFAREQAAGLGRVTNFSVRIFSLMGLENKYLGTQWRSKPDYQGGFLLDAGVHQAAATRFILSAGGSDGNDSKADTVHAITDRVTEYLLPIDTVNAIIRTRSGATGTYQHSMGSKMSAFEWHFAYEKGSISIVGDTVTVKPDGRDEIVRHFPRAPYVNEEVAAWARAIADGKPDPLQSVEEALGDLEFLERMFQSGEQNGALQRYQFQ
ncbi:Oxidoreductase family, NAD-binding Rossmann fold [Geosmithia morbida]|uniref:Oxidoreductase family, NAD-binding Rossmann fold n=1 Tax=Geosmithia morbida TaxID=1094350 RepID=A0A9P4YTG0_9HYPO|nr:Oxidoreductase family, NAD-binding Rossmann fold [Geosmithia morbida]KAF4121464.1 Oxidoreductase family, NAD-binding Rossmann fold [Geosmithia morbida]